MQPGDPVGVGVDGLEHQPLLLVGEPVPLGEQRRGEALDAGQRRPQLVGDGRDQLGPARSAGPGPRCPRSATTTRSPASAAAVAHVARGDQQDPPARQARSSRSGCPVRDGEAGVRAERSTHQVAAARVLAAGRTSASGLPDRSGLSRRPGQPRRGAVEDDHRSRRGPATTHAVGQLVAARTVGDGLDCHPAQLHGAVPSPAAGPRRWARAEAYRQTAAAVARLRLSAAAVDRHPHDVVGERARSSSGRPQASLPNTQAVGPASVAVVGQRRRGRGRRRRRRRAPRRPAAAERADRGSTRRRPTTTGRWNRLPAEARTHLPLYGSTLAVGQHDRVGAGGVGGADRPCRRCRGRAPAASTATSRGRAGQRPSASGTSTNAQTATMPCGVTVSRERRDARSPTPADRDAGRVGAVDAGRRAGRAAVGGRRTARRTRRAAERPRAPPAGPRRGTAAAASRTRARQPHGPPRPAATRAAASSDGSSGRARRPAGSVGAAQAAGALTSAGQRACAATSTSAANAAGVVDGELGEHLAVDLDARRPSGPG